MFAGFSICERKTYDSFKSEEIDIRVYLDMIQYIEFDIIIDADAHRSYISTSRSNSVYIRVKRSSSCKTKGMLGRKLAKRRSSKRMDK